MSQNSRIRLKFVIELYTLVLGRCSLIEENRDIFFLMVFFSEDTKIHALLRYMSHAPHNPNFMFNHIDSAKFIFIHNIAFIITENRFL